MVKYITLSPFFIDYKEAGINKRTRTFWHQCLTFRSLLILVFTLPRELWPIPTWLLSGRKCVWVCVYLYETQRCSLLVEFLIRGSYITQLMLWKFHLFPQQMAGSTSEQLLYKWESIRICLTISVNIIYFLLLLVPLLFLLLHLLPLHKC